MGRGLIQNDELQNAYKKIDGTAACLPGWFFFGKRAGG